MVRINIIGAGKVGQTLGKLWADSQSVEVGSIYNRTITNAQRAVEYYGAGMVAPTLYDLEPANVYLISTTDDAIESIAESLALLEIIPTGAVVFHCSGFMSSGGLDPLKSIGCHVASVHPVKSFANILHSVQTFTGTYCGFEGDFEARAILSPLFEQIGGIIFDIDKENKAIYHAAGVFACNYVVTLAHAAATCYASAGVPDEVSKALLIQLVRNTMDNIEHSHMLTEALTGPIQRGDINTIRGHLQVLINTPLDNLYRQIGQATISLANHSLVISQALMDEFTR